MSKWPNCDATQTRHVVPITECIYQVSNWYLKACWRKVWKTRTDGRADGQMEGGTLPRHNTSVFQTGVGQKKNERGAMSIHEICQYINWLIWSSELFDTTVITKLHTTTPAMIPYDMIPYWINFNSPDNFYSCLSHSQWECDQFH